MIETTEKQTVANDGNADPMFSGEAPCCTDGMTVLDLFSGIGGFSLGLERAGMRTIAFCEIEEFPRRVLRKHWPNVPIFEDVRKLHATDLPENPDIICGGFPCQNIARCGRREGLEGEKSGLWAEIYRLVCDIRPKYVLLENSTGLTKHGLDVVCKDLAEIGYDTEWDCLPAYAFGAPHIRDRIYLLAYPCSRRHWTQEETVFAGWTSSQLHAGWASSSGICRVDDGVPGRVDRLRALGNAVVPQIIEHIGMAITKLG